MITLIPSGGLGNQMFQYAAAKSLALQRDTSVIIDLSFYSLYQHKDWCRAYSLDIFRLDATLRNGNIKTKSLCRLDALIGSKPWGKNIIRKMNVFTDLNSHLYDTRFESLNDNTILFGTFQNELYFRNYRDEIMKEFSFGEPMGMGNEVIAAKIYDSNAVSLHIRRDDYISNTNAARNFVHLSMDYYNNAISYIRSHVSDPLFFIFSDDMEWAKNNFPDIPCVFVDINKGDASYNDMRLMSLCRHNIIANSSFSWWGAYLNRNGDKTVIAPAQWMKGNRNIAAMNIIPPDWVKL